MKLVVIFSVLCATASAVPTFLAGGPTFIAEAIPLRTQFVAQDAIGQYSYGYAGESAARSETKSFDGVTRGAYSYVDAEGKLQSVEYTADALNGFRASATNLPTSPVDNGLAPEPVRETEEVAKARAEHLAAFKEAEIRAAAAPEEPEAESEAAEQQDTAEDGEMEAQGASGGQVPASTSAASPGTIAIRAPIATIQAVPAIAAVSTIPSIAVRTLEAPASSSYSYQVESNPGSSYSYSIAQPAVVAAPLKTINAYSFAAAPVIARSPLELISERQLNINGRIATFQ